MKSSIEISVKTHYLQRESYPEGSQFVFVYQITISNLGVLSVTLVSRHWIITNANQTRREVRGEGVVGQQPVINANDSFTYSSSVVLDTPTGTMHGTYQLESESGDQFDAAIAPFFLVTPTSVH